MKSYKKHDQVRILPKEMLEDVLHQKGWFNSPTIRQQVIKQIAGKEGVVVDVIKEDNVPAYEVYVNRRCNFVLPIEAIEYETTT